MQKQTLPYKSNILQTLTQQWLCPISQQPMIHPVMASDGHSYQKSHIKQWFNRGDNRSPITRQYIPQKKLIPNYVLQNVINKSHQIIPKFEKKFNQSEQIIQILLEQKQQLSFSIISLESRHKKQKWDLQEKLNKHYNQQVQKMTKIHEINMKKQIQKLTDLYDKISIENKTLKNEKNCLQENIILFKKDIYDFKFKIQDLQRLSQKQKSDLKQQLMSRHLKQLKQIKHQYHQQLSKLESQIISLQHIKAQKSEQISQLIREKNSLRSQYELQCNSLKQQILNKQLNFQLLEYKLNFLQNRIRQKQQQLDKLNTQFKQLQQSTSRQIMSLKQLVEQRQKVYLQESYRLENKNKLFKQNCLKQQENRQLIGIFVFCVVIIGFILMVGYGLGIYDHNDGIREEKQIYFKSKSDYMIDNNDKVYKLQFNKQFFLQQQSPNKQTSISLPQIFNRTYNSIIIISSTLYNYFKQQKLSEYFIREQSYWQRLFEINQYFIQVIRLVHQYLKFEYFCYYCDIL